MTTNRNPLIRWTWDTWNALCDTEDTAVVTDAERAQWAADDAEAERRQRGRSGWKRAGAVLLCLLVMVGVAMAVCGGVR